MMFVASSCFTSSAYVSLSIRLPMFLDVDVSYGFVTWHVTGLVTLALLKMSQADTTQRLQYPEIKEYTLNHIGDRTII